MPAPTTMGQLRTNIQDMQIGDYIVWSYSNSTGHVMGDTKGFPELSVAGVANGSITHYWYGVKVDKGLIVSDRVVAHSWSWDSVNSNKQIQGLPYTISGIAGIIRSLTGGVAYADANGNISTADQGFGAWPTNNEWDKYIVGFPTYKIQAGKTLDDVFHVNSNATFCQDTPVLGLRHINVPSLTATSSHRTFRGVEKSPNTYKTLGFIASSSSYAWIGFRPVFEYKEV